MKFKIYLFVFFISINVFAEERGVLGSIKIAKEISSENFNLQKFINNEYGFDLKLKSEIQSFWNEKKSFKVPLVKVDGKFFTFNIDQEVNTVEIQNSTDKGFYFKFNEHYYFFDYQKTFNENLNIFKLTTNTNQMVDYSVGIGFVLTLVYKELYLNSKESIEITNRISRLENEIERMKKSCLEKAQLNDVSQSLDKIKKLISFYNKTTNDFDLFCKDFYKKFSHVSENSILAVSKACFNYKEAKLCLKDRIYSSEVSNGSINQEKIFYKQNIDQFDISN